MQMEEGDEIEKEVGKGRKGRGEGGENEKKSTLPQSY